MLAPLSEAGFMTIWGADVMLSPVDSYACCFP
jgi:hypothetical protein